MRLGRFWTFCPLRDLSPLQGPLRADRLTGRPLRGRLLTGRPLTGRFLTGDTFNYRKAYGKLQGGSLPELGGNFRLCAIDQKRPFFLRAEPVLDLLPFKGPFPLTGAPTGRPLHGKAPYGEASYGKAPYGEVLAGDTFNYRKAYGKLRGGSLQELGGNFRLCAIDQKRPFFLTVGPFLDFLPFKGPFPLTGALTGRPPYGKAPYGEASYGKALYGEASYGRHL